VLDAPSIARLAALAGTRFAAFLACLLFTTSAMAQAELERFERSLEQIRREQAAGPSLTVSPDRRLLVEYGAFITLSYLTLDDHRGDNHVLRQYELVGYTRLNLDDVHEVFLRGRAGYRDFNDGDSFDGRGDEVIDPDLERGYYRLNLTGPPGELSASTGGLVVKAGRDLVYWGNGLTLSQVLDGVVVALSGRVLELEAVAGVTPVRTVDFDASRPNFDHNTRRGFYGAMLSARLGSHRPYVFGLLQRDYNHDDTLVTGPIVTRFEYDSWYLGAGVGGSFGDRLVYGVEAVYEGGHGLSHDVTVNGLDVELRQESERIEAAAADARIDYLAGDAARTRLSAELILASGDPDRRNTSNTINGNRTGTTDRAFNAFGLLNTGLAFAPEVSNLIAVRIGAASFPLTGGEPWNRMQIGTDLFLFGKLLESAPINEPTSDDRYLGWEPDLFVNWRVTSDLSLAVRYGVFFPGSAIVTNDDPRQFFYIGVTYAF
jgi:hypothetical protein